MTKVDSIARRILGWKLNRWDKWYDPERCVFIHDSEFQPQKNLDHAMLIVERLEKFGIKFTKKENLKVAFNDISATGDTLAQAITNAAYSLVQRDSQVASTRMWEQKLY